MVSTIGRQTQESPSKCRISLTTALDDAVWSGGLAAEFGAACPPSGGKPDLQPPAEGNGASMSAAKEEDQMTGIRKAELTKTVAESLDRQEIPHELSEARGEKEDISVEEGAELTSGVASRGPRPLFRGAAVREPVVSRGDDEVLSLAASRSSNPSGILGRDDAAFPSTSSPPMNAAEPTTSFASVVLEEEIGADEDEGVGAALSATVCCLTRAATPQALLDLLAGVLDQVDEWRAGMRAREEEQEEEDPLGANRRGVPLMVKIRLTNMDGVPFFGASRGAASWAENSAERVHYETQKERLLRRLYAGQQSNQFHLEAALRPGVDVFDFALELFVACADPTRTGLRYSPLHQLAGFRYGFPSLDSGVFPSSLTIRRLSEWHPLSECLLALPALHRCTPSVDTGLSDLMSLSVWRRGRECVLRRCLRVQARLHSQAAAAAAGERDHRGFGLAAADVGATIDSPFVVRDLPLSLVLLLGRPIRHQLLRREERNDLLLFWHWHALDAIAVLDDPFKGNRRTMWWERLPVTRVSMLLQQVHEIQVQQKHLRMRTQWLLPTTAHGTAAGAAAGSSSSSSEVMVVPFREGEDWRERWLQSESEATSTNGSGERPVTRIFHMPTDDNRGNANAAWRRDESQRSASVFLSQEESVDLPTTTNMVTDNGNAISPFPCGVVVGSNWTQTQRLADYFRSAALVHPCQHFPIGGSTVVHQLRLWCRQTDHSAQISDRRELYLTALDQGQRANAVVIPVSTGVVERLLAALWSEAFRLLSSQHLCTAEVLEQVAVHLLHLRTGPLALLLHVYGAETGIGYLQYYHKVMADRVAAAHTRSPSGDKDHMPLQQLYHSPAAGLTTALRRLTTECGSLLQEEDGAQRLFLQEGYRVQEDLVNLYLRQPLSAPEIADCLLGAMANTVADILQEGHVRSAAELNLLSVAALGFQESTGGILTVLQRRLRDPDFLNGMEQRWRDASFTSMVSGATNVPVSEKPYHPLLLDMAKAASLEMWVSDYLTSA